jgi:ankyrin repeat protein
MIDLLRSRGADLEAARFDGARPIHLVSGDYYFRGGRDVPRDWPVSPRQVFDHLRAAGAACDLATAAWFGELDLVRELLRADPALANRLCPYVSYYVGSGAPLKNAAAGGHMEIVKLLLEHGADPNLREEGIAPHGHALYAAAANRHYDIAKLLLERGANPNPEVESSADALSRAISNADQPMIELLCSYGAARRVHLLAYDGDIATAAAVFAANPKLADDPEALANAAAEGRDAFVRLMVRYCPDLPSRTAFADWQIGPKSLELCQWLFDHGMDPSQRDWLLVTPLHRLARRGDVERAALYLDRGADLHARDEDFSSTPLAWAARFGQRGMVELLLARGAQTNLPDDPPWATPLAWATRCGRDDIVQLLTQHGAT